LILNNASSTIVPKVKLPAELGKYTEQDTELIGKLNFKKIIKTCRRKGDLGNLSFPYPAIHILLQYKKYGIPEKLSSKP